MMHTAVGFIGVRPSERRSVFLPLCFGAFTLVVLSGYALLGKGFAYVGIPPYAYVGELGVLLGAATLLTGVHTRMWSSGIVWLLVAFMTWGLVCTIPYINTYGIDSLRDAVIWGYAIYALAVASAVLRTNAIAKVVELYGRALPLFLLIAPIAVGLHLLAHDHIPRWPWGPDGGVSILFLKPSDVAVQYAGAFPFIVFGLSSTTLGPVWMILWVLGASPTLALTRGALLTISVVVGLVLMLRPALKYYYMFGLAVVCTAIIYLAFATVSSSGLNLGLENQRALSLDQIVQNIESIFLDDAHHGTDLGANKVWREMWWSKIMDYTVNGGEHFWTGKGFGVNLADDDGFSDGIHHDLRSPHSAHMTILARTGVPGLALWIALQLAFAVKLFLKTQRDRRANKPFLAAIELWILLYWLAFVINGSFDVFLEGPQGGIWFWSVFGFGLALIINTKTLPADSADISPAPNAAHGRLNA